MSRFVDSRLGPFVNPYLYASFEKPSGAVTVRTNHFTNPGAGGSVGFGRWPGNAGDVATMGVFDVSWSASGKATRNTWSQRNGDARGDIGALIVSATAGERWTVVWKLNGSKSGTYPAPQFYGTRGGSVLHSTSGPVDLVAGVPAVRWMTFTRQESSGSDLRAANLIIAAVGVGDFIEISEVDLYSGDYQPDRAWFYGSTPDAGDFEYVWSGAENASPSYMLANGILGVTDSGAYQSQEWAAEGDYSAFVPEGKSIKVEVASPSTVKVIAESPGQVLLGSTGVEVRRNLIRASNPTVATGAGIGGSIAGGGRTFSVVPGVGVEGSNAVRVTATENGSNLGWGAFTNVLPPGQHRISLYARANREGLGVFHAYAQGTAALTRSESSNVTLTTGWLRASQLVTVTAAGTIQAGGYLGGAVAIPGDWVEISGVQVENGTLLLPYISGASPATLSGIPVWAGAVNASETIVYGVTSDTATTTDDVLEVQATGHLAMLAGRWDKLTTVAGTYTGSPFTGSPPGKWLGAADESASVSYLR